MPVVDSANRLRVVVESLSTPGTAATSLAKGEDNPHASGDAGVMSLGVRKDTAAALAGTDGDYAPLEVDASGRLHTTNAAISGSELLIAGGATQTNDVKVTLDSETVTVQAFSAMLEMGLTELIGNDEAVAQNQFAASAPLSLATPGAVVSGEILSMALYATTGGTGAIITDTGKIFLFDADPAISAADTSITGAEWKTVFGIHDVADADWDEDANGAIAFYRDLHIPFHAMGTVYIGYYYSGADAWNTLAGDDENLHINVWYRRES